MLVSWPLLQISEFHFCEDQRWAFSLTFLLTSLLIVWTPRLIKLKDMIYVCRIAFFVGLFSFFFFFNLDLGPFCAVCALRTLFSFTCCCLSDGDILWRDCAWEEYSNFLVSRHTDSLGCVPEVS